MGIVRAMVELAHALGLSAIAEGVETAEQLRVLRGLGCDGVQGWRVARPMPAADVAAWVWARGGTVGRADPGIEVIAPTRGVAARG